MKRRRIERESRLPLNALYPIFNTLAKGSLLNVYVLRDIINNTPTKAGTYTKIPIRNDYRNQCLYKFLYLMRCKGYVKQLPSLGKTRNYKKVKNIKLSVSDGIIFKKRGKYQMKKSSSAVILHQEKNIKTLQSVKCKLNKIITLQQSVNLLKQKLETLTSDVAKEIKLLGGTL